ncbi:MAG: polysaccharide deacetylase family protein [Chitinophagaceae bacterium]
MKYLVRTPKIISKLIFPGYVWDMEDAGNRLFLTFDDGPHPEATPYVLDLLKEYQARATFFCIGKNVRLYPEIYKRIILEGHKTGNHTMNHLNGWKTDDAIYLKNVVEASQYIDTNLFRPPYGRIGAFQAKQIKEALGLKIIMWTVLSGDFDRTISAAQCWQNIKSKTREGSIVVFHDSEKAMPRMRQALKDTLEYFSEKKMQFDSIS